MLSVVPLLAALATITRAESGLAPLAPPAPQWSQASGAVSPRRTRAFIPTEDNSATVYVGVIGLRGGEKADISVFAIEPARHKGEFLLGLPLVTSRDPMRVPATVPIYIGLRYVQDPPARTGTPVTVVCGASVTLTAKFRYNVLCDVDAHLMIVRLG